MNITRTTTLLIFSLLASFASANTGSTKGNGGYVVSCNTEQGTTYQTLDLFEVEKNRNARIQTFESESAITIALKVVAQLKNVSPRRAEIYRKHVREFMYDTSFIENAVFTDVQDAYPIYLPNNCKLVPAAIQTRITLPEEPKYYVNADVWKKLTPVNQAALMLHEIVYMEFGHELSVLTRAFVGLLFSDTFRNTYDTPQAFLELLLLFKAPYYEQHGLMIDLKSPLERYPESGVVKSGRVFAGGFDNGIATFEYSAGEVQFYKNGSPIFLKLHPDQKTYYPVTCLGQTQIRNMYDGKVYFYKNGGLWKADYVAKPSLFTNDCENLLFEVDPQDAREFLEENEATGFLGSFEFSPTGSLIMTKGLRVTFDRNVSPFVLRGKIQFYDGLKPQSGTLDRPAILPFQFGEFSAESNRPVKFRNDGFLQCATAQGDHFFEDEHRIYRILAGQEYCTN